MSSDCEKENLTQHVWGQRYGFGPVKSGEFLLLAVFERDKYDPINKQIKNNFFKNDKLKKFDVSLARQKYISRKSFEKYVIRPRERDGEKFVGITEASYDSIKALMVNVPTFNPPLHGRSFCILDVVRPPDDHDSHAAIGYSENQENLTKKQKENVRSRINVDLVQQFSPIKLIEDVSFGVDSRKEWYRRAMLQLQGRILKYARRLK